MKSQFMTKFHITEFECPNLAITVPLCESFNNHDMAIDSKRVRRLWGVRGGEEEEKKIEFYVISIFSVCSSLLVCDNMYLSDL